MADEDPTKLRISIDAKAHVILGDFSRGGKSRVIVKALDHDMQVNSKITPFGIYLPQYDELYLYMATSSVTSDFIVDCLEDFWTSISNRFPIVDTLVLNLDNGPENSSRRTQFIQRLVDFTDLFLINIQLAYYPPYHSKYNPVERVWAILENHWNGALLDSCQTAVKFASTMRYNGSRPTVALVERFYQKGVSLTQKAMSLLEMRLHRLPKLEKWFVSIYPSHHLIL